MQENGRRALRVITRDLTMMGYWAGIMDSNDIGVGNAAAGTDCLAGGWILDLDPAMQFTNDATVSPYDCITGSELEGRSDIVAIKRASDQPEMVVDLNAIEGGEDPENFTRLLKPGDVVAGKALDSDAGIEAAVAAGASGIICTHRLPALLGVYHHLSASDET